MYFNIDNLDNLDFGIDYTGNELEGAPDLKSVISKYLTGDVQSEQYTSEESDEIWSLNGLLEHSNVPGFLAQVSPYDKWRESLDKESTASNIKSTMYDMSAAKRSGVSKGRKTRSALGQTGLMSGAGQGLLKAHEGDVSRALSGLEGNINKQVLSYQKGINKRRAGYVDELWDLYGTFLEAAPDKYKAVPEEIPLYQQTNEDGGYVADENIQDQFGEDGWDIINDDGTVPDEVLDDDNASWVNATACSMAGGTMQFADGGAYCDADNYSNYVTLLDNYNDCPSTWVQSAGTCNSGTVDPDDPYQTVTCECGMEWSDTTNTWQCMPC